MQALPGIAYSAAKARYYLYEGEANLGFLKGGVRFADAISEWGPLIAHVSQSETVQFAYGKHEVPKPAELLNAGEYRLL